MEPLLHLDLYGNHFKTNSIKMQVSTLKRNRNYLPRVLGGIMICLFSFNSLSAQGIGIGTETPNAKAALDITSTDKGLLIPRMTTAQRTAMAPNNADAGMMVYDISLQEFMYHNGNAWEKVAGAASPWNQVGISVNYMAGNVGVGTTIPFAKFQVYNTVTNQGFNMQNAYSGTSTKYGLFNSVDQQGSNTRYGIYNTVSSNNSISSSSYGIYNYNASNSTNGTVYGIYSNVTNGGTGTRYGMYSYAYGSGNYALFASNSHSAGYAGYFQGRGHFTSDLFVGSLITIDALGYQSGGEIIVKGSGDKEGVRLRGNEGANNGGAVLVYNKAGEVQIELDGEFGDGGPGRIITDELQIKGGSDLSENFDIISNAESTEPIPGMLVSIDPNSSGKLIISTESYDRKVAGIISGANGVNPGMLMGQEETIADGEYPIALSGRVYVYADTSNGPIQPGDLLTSSKKPGHAMKAKDYKKAQGAVIGKAMTELEEGTGFVLVLVNLQ